MFQSRSIVFGLVSTLGSAVLHVCLVAVPTSAETVVSEQGNPQCWIPGTHLERENCCDTWGGAAPEGNPECWDMIRSFSRCCTPGIYQTECWDYARGNMTLAVGPLPWIMSDEMYLETTCCRFGLAHQCWGWDETVLYDPLQDNYEGIGHQFAACCLPALRFLLRSEKAPPSMQEMIDSELAPWKGRLQHVTPDDMKRHEKELDYRGCHIRIKGGEIFPCEAASISRNNFSTSDRPPRWCARESHILSSFLTALHILRELAQLPDVEFILCCVDDADGCGPDPYVPVLTQVRKASAKRALRIPHSHILHVWSKRMEFYIPRDDELPWISKVNRLVFRGSPGGDRVPWVARVTAKADPNLHNVHLTQDAYRQKLASIFPAEVLNDSLWAPPLSLKQQLMHKYILDIDGGGGPSDRFLWIGLSTSVPVIVEGPTARDESWMAALRTPYVDYVPMRTDGSDFAQVLDWLQANDEEAQRIGEASRHLTNSAIRFEHALHWVYRLLTGLSSLGVQSAS
eukprot:TRINITY_DN29203_c0_g1_i1.p1 TRINITY_DN29203_c0_g1~~TRINITY_DN29203_c0_g1_i1.p1  ORF type:complete len:513 (+),score=66.70 TRINITY_DN29203_c0_g1_i1:60-1598(+)